MSWDVRFVVRRDDETPATVISSADSDLEELPQTVGGLRTGLKMPMIPFPPSTNTV